MLGLYSSFKVCLVPSDEVIEGWNLVFLSLNSQGLPKVFVNLQRKKSRGERKITRSLLSAILGVGVGEWFTRQSELKGAINRPSYRDRRHKGQKQG